MVCGMGRKLKNRKLSLECELNLKTLSFKDRSIAISKFLRTMELLCAAVT